VISGTVISAGFADTADDTFFLQTGLNSTSISHSTISTPSSKICNPAMRTHYDTAEVATDTSTTSRGGARSESLAAKSSISETLVAEGLWQRNTWIADNIVPLDYMAVASDSIDVNTFREPPATMGAPATHIDADDGTPVAAAMRVSITTVATMEDSLQQISETSLVSAPQTDVDAVNTPAIRVSNNIAAHADSTQQAPSEITLVSAMHLGATDVAGRSALEPLAAAMEISQSWSAQVASMTVHAVALHTGSDDTGSDDTVCLRGASRDVSEPCPEPGSPWPQCTDAGTS